MRKIFITILVIGAAVYSASAQQDPKFTHYMFNQNIYNPAFVGIEMKDKLCANLVQHNQWLGFNPEDGSTAPVTTAFNIHSPFTINKLLPGRKFGGGLVFVNDGLGHENSTLAYGALSYHHPINDNSTLSVGLNVGIVQKSIGTDKLRAIIESDPVLQALKSDGQDVVFDMGLGLLYNAKNYYVGFSTLHLPQANYEWYGSGVDDSNRVMRTYYINGGYNYSLSKFLVLQPRALIKLDRAKWQVDLGALLEYNNKYWGGLNVRRGEGIMILAGLTAKSSTKDELKIGVSYDLTLSKLQTVSDGTLELMVNYCFKINLKPQMPKPTFTPRFMDGYTQ